MRSGKDVCIAPDGVAMDRGAARWSCIPLLFALALGGCGDLIVVHSDLNTNRDVQRHLAWATEGYPMRTLVMGNPFPGAAEVFSAAVTSAMSGANPGPPVRFSADPDEPNLKPYRVVMLFNPDIAVWGRELCGGSPRGAASVPAGRIRISAGFCFGDDALSEARVEVGGVSGPDDPRFRQAVAEATYYLFPPDEPQGESDPTVPD